MLVATLLISVAGMLWAIFELSTPGADAQQTAQRRAWRTGAIVFLVFALAFGTGYAFGGGLGA